MYSEFKMCMHKKAIHSLSWKLGVEYMRKSVNAILNNKHIKPYALS
jgi:hypothetical protein